MAHFGSPDALLGATATQLEEAVPRLQLKTACAVLEGRLSIDLDQELELIEKFGVRIVTVADDDYPANLRQTPDAPALLYYLGELAEGDRYAITIVGTRRTTSYGRTTCEKIAGGLADVGLTIVSGLALGVDSSAHLAALRHDGRTLAVMGCGLSRVYPEENEGLAWKITQNGAVMSEYAMTMEPDRFNFPERNEILAALALGTIVVEAPTRSGALLTARAALEMGRSVYAVPGDVTRANSRGANGLIREGATLVRDAADVLEDLEPQLRELLGEREEAGATPTAKTETVEGLDLIQAQIHELVKEDAAHFDEIIETAHERGVEVDTAQLAAILLQLELKGLIHQAPGKMFVAEEVADYSASNPAESSAQVE